MNLLKLYLPFLIFFLTQCNPGNEVNDNGKNSMTQKPKERVEIKYTVISLKNENLDSFKMKYTPEQLAIILALNRVDENHLNRMDTIIIPDNFEVELIQYSPFPVSLPFLNEIKKMIFFSYPTQSFAVYNYGILVHWGPTNMGIKTEPTPTGIYYANWKAEETKSTFNDEWILKWNVNLENKLGIGWHQYSMPGYPASHSCLRLLEADAKYLYEWVDDWELRDKENVLIKGTPALVFGSYPFGGRKPWLSLLTDPHALDITEQALANEVNCLPEIKKWAQKRDSFISSKTN